MGAGRAIKQCVLWVVFASGLLAQGPPPLPILPGWTSIKLRGIGQDLIYVPPAPGVTLQAPVLFLPGDGGWRGFAVELAEHLASEGHPVYGLDTKKYLTSFTAARGHLTVRSIAGDLHHLLAWMVPHHGAKVLVVGWSQGAAMALLAAHGRTGHRDVLGVIALSLPEEAALGWSWKDTLLSVFRKRPAQPHFPVAEQIPGVTPVPIALIHPSQDAYTTPNQVTAMFRLAKAPKRLRIICGASHSFAETRSELWQVLETILVWTRQPRPEDATPGEETQRACSGVADSLRVN